MNVVTLIGRLTKNPELKRTQNSCFAVFTLAADRDFKREGEPTADFIRCQAWGKTAENLCRFMTKGSLIGLSGRINVSDFTGQDGNRVTITQVVADRIQFLEKREQQNPQNTYNPTQNAYNGPQTAQPAYSLPQQQAGAYRPDTGNMSGSGSYNAQTGYTNAPMQGAYTQPVQQPINYTNAGAYSDQQREQQIKEVFGDIDRDDLPF